MGSTRRHSQKPTDRNVTLTLFILIFYAILTDAHCDEFPWIRIAYRTDGNPSIAAQHVSPRLLPTAGSSRTTDLATETIELPLQSQYDETENRLGHAQVLQLLKPCLRTYFTFDGTIYEQVKGTPMGSPISGFIAEAVLQRLESLVFQHHRPKFWARYVDDTFVVIERDQVLTFQEHLNAVFPDMQFTMEEEENNQLAFLDVLNTPYFVTLSSLIILSNPPPTILLLLLIIIIIILLLPPPTSSSSSVSSTSSSPFYTGTHTPYSIIFIQVLFPPPHCLSSRPPLPPQTHQPPPLQHFLPTCPSRSHTFSLISSSSSSSFISLSPLLTPHVCFIHHSSPSLLCHSSLDTPSFAFPPSPPIVSSRLFLLTLTSDPKIC
ncbi:hypothetical protein SprV_0802646500 [Sparganum proliferum]